MTITVAYLRYLIAVYPYLEAGRLPKSERAPDERARGRVTFGPKPPTATVIIKADFDQAIDRLPPTLAEVVRVRIKAGNTGRAARHLRRRKRDVITDLDAALELLVELMESPSEVRTKVS